MCVDFSNVMKLQKQLQTLQRHLDKEHRNKVSLENKCKSLETQKSELNKLVYTQSYYSPFDYFVGETGVQLNTFSVFHDRTAWNVDVFLPDIYSVITMLPMCATMGSEFRHRFL